MKWGVVFHSLQSLVAAGTVTADFKNVTGVTSSFAKYISTLKSEEKRAIVIPFYNSLTFFLYTWKRIYR